MRYTALRKESMELLLTTMVFNLKKVVAMVE